MSTGGQGEADRSDGDDTTPIPDWQLDLAGGFSDSIAGIPGATSFHDRWRFLENHMPASSRLFRHERTRCILLGNPVQLWSTYSTSYHAQVSIHALEITRLAESSCEHLALRIFSYGPGRGGGGRACDLVLLEHLSWTSDHRTRCFVFRGTSRTEARFPNCSFSLRHLPRGSRLLYILSPDIEPDQERGGGVFDPSCVGKPSDLYRLRIIFSVPYTRRGRQEAWVRSAVGPSPF